MHNVSRSIRALTQSFVYTDTNVTLDAPEHSWKNRKHQNQENVCKQHIYVCDSRQEDIDSFQWLLSAFPPPTLCSQHFLSLSDFISNRLTKIITKIKANSCNNQNFQAGWWLHASFLRAAHKDIHNLFAVCVQLIFLNNKRRSRRRQRKRRGGSLSFFRLLCCSSEPPLSSLYLLMSAQSVCLWTVITRQ